MARQKITDGESLRKWRIDGRIAQMMFARESGLSQSAISAFERYGSVSDETLAKIRETVANWQTKTV
jgi:predicted transcriptional regulator